MDMLKHALAYGAAGFKVFPIAPGTKNKPLCKWADEATTDPKKITEWWTRTPRANIGFNAGASGCVVVDVDSKDGRNGFKTLDDLSGEGYNLSDTRMQRTPSGGLQYIYRGACATTQNAIGKHLYTGADESHIDTRGGIDGKGYGYVLLPPSTTAADTATHTKNGIYEWINGATHRIAPVPAWVVEQCSLPSRTHNIDQTFPEGVEVDQPTNITDYIYYLKNDAPFSIEGQGGERALLLVAARGKDFGLSQMQVIRCLGEHYNSELTGKCSPEWEMEGKGPDSLPVKVANAFEYCHELAPGAITGEGEFTAANGDEPVKPSTTHQTDGDPIEPEMATRVNSPPPEGDGSPAKIADAWLDDFLAPPAEQIVAERIWTYQSLRKEWVYIAATARFVLRSDPKISLKKEVFDDLMAYCTKDPNGIKKVSYYLFHEKGSKAMPKLMQPVFKPGRPEFVNDDGLLNFNVYRPSGIVPKQGDTRFWNEHLEYLFPDPVDRDHVLNWCGWFLRHLNKKPKHALLVAGHYQGTGKSYIGEMLAAIIGQRNVSNLGPAELSSTFNRWALASKLLIIEELRGLDKREIAQKLHPLVTQERITINNKGEATFDADNCFGIYAMSNEDAAIPLDNTDRRWLVIVTAATPKEKSYYSMLYNHLAHPTSVSAVAWELMHRDLADYDGQARAPDTAAKQEMIEAGRTDFESWLVSMKENDPFTRDLICIEDDIVPIIDPRFGKPGMNTGIMRAIRSFLKHHCQGIQHPVQHTLSNKHRVRLWMLNGSGAPGKILSQCTLSDRVKRYESQVVRLRKAAASDSGRDFGHAE